MRKSLAAWFERRMGRLGPDPETAAPTSFGIGHALGAALAALVVVEAATGLILMAGYSPSATTAWGSVWYLDHMTPGGWLVRGVHRVATSALVGVVVLILIHQVFTRKYAAPREFHWWLTVGLLGLVIGLGLSGNILPWDQRGYWAATVETTLAGSVPVIGPPLRTVILGGSRPGNLTLTRIYTLHIVVLPILLYGVLRARRKLARGLDGEPTGVDPARLRFLQMLVAAVVLGVLAFGVAQIRGVPLEAPADPASDYAARPEWYVLWLNRMLHLLPPGFEVLGTAVLPGAIVGLLLALPLFDGVLKRESAFAAARMALILVVVGAGYLTIEGLWQDRNDVGFQESHREAVSQARRASVLASDTSRGGIPPSGASDLLHTDPLTRGMTLLEQKCLGCHAYGTLTQIGPRAPYQGWNLEHYANRDWVRRLLKNPSAPEFRGHVLQEPGATDTTEAPLSGMITWKKSMDLEPQELDDVADFVATFAQIPAQTAFESWSADPKIEKHPGYEIFVENCCQCHAVGDWGAEDKLQKAPGMFAYGSPAWVAQMIKAPGTDGFYGYLKPHQQMPGFAEQLSPNDLSMLVRLLADDFVGHGNPGNLPTSGE